MTRRFLQIVVALALVTAALIAAPQRAQAAWAVPGAPGAVAQSTTAVAISWSAVWGAPRYLVKYSTSASWTSPKYVRTSEANAELTGLRSGTTYYVKVAVTKTTGDKLTGYGSTSKVTTRTSGSGYVTLTPGGLTAASRSDDWITLSWRGRSGSPTYQVRYATSADFSDAAYATTSSTSVTIRSLARSTRYWVSIRTKSTAGAATSTFSSPITVSTTAGETFAPLRAASYNIMCSNCTTSHPWSKRRAALVEAIRSQRVDVLGVQEASQGLTAGADGTNKAQFDDLVDLLGDDYALANAHRYNCEKSTSPNNCAALDRGASGGVRIIYDRTRIDLLRQGSIQFEAQDPASTKRFAAWAELEQLATGKRFFVINTHVDPKDDAAGSSLHYTIRAAQAREVLATVKRQNTGKLPVLILGDFKATKYAKPSNAPYALITGAGYLDPLGNTPGSTVPDRSAIVETRIGTAYNSMNNLAASPGRSTYLNGSLVDYVYVSAGVRVAEWQTVVDVTSSGRFAAKPPSDHNMVRVTAYLP